MRLLLDADVFGWRMTGLMGAGGAWFLGFSRSRPKPRRLPSPAKSAREQRDMHRRDGTEKR